MKKSNSVKLNAVYAFNALKEGKVPEIVGGNSLRGFLNCLEPFCSEDAIFLAFRNYLKRGTKICKFRNFWEIHPWVSFKKKGGEIVLTVKLEDWRTGRMLINPLQFFTTLEEITNYVKAA